MQVTSVVKAVEKTVTENVKHIVLTLTEEEARVLAKAANTPTWSRVGDDKAVEVLEEVVSQVRSHFPIGGWIGHFRDAVSRTL